jgi:hypothetical protein
VLRGKSTTMAWRSLSQEIDVQKGKTYTLEFEALAENVRRQGRQYDNCYVGVMSFDRSGKKADASIKDLSRLPRWARQSVNFRVPPNAAKTQLIIFLSKSGSLMVKDVTVKEANPRRPFRSSRR